LLIVNPLEFSESFGASLPGGNFSTANHTD
jgi:hypothetical protein